MSGWEFLTRKALADLAALVEAEVQATKEDLAKIEARIAEGSPLPWRRHLREMAKLQAAFLRLLGELRAEQEARRAA